MKKIVVAISLVGLAQMALGQHHVNSWFKAALVWRINKQFKTELELHHRRQNGFDNSNLLSNNLLYLGRVWLHYQPHQNLTLSLSPFAKVVNYKVIQTKTDETLQPTQEIRITGALAWRKAIADKWQLQLRTMGEYRLFNNPQYHIIRLRQRAGLGYQLSSQLNLVVYDEVLGNITDRYTHTFYDHNRIGTSIGYQCNRHFKVDLGYIHINRHQRNTDHYWEEENIALGLTCSF